ncbi:hypothetical protein BCR41DRAFT_244276 [Lobosporangium transversale]|uniref:Uncharacterized protein n=1 Tax=Lobosporangium transversale TaxID=64571 RepID=A0A1Y2GVG7_9FUNG|nr:hypothetical protein BCR41DRAFT_244276 [Lobosporangium transversale]ORZ23692.1 hypothetical protein BCR41DRAFT_244276 [Lobosporangium transversale]|eukprot:XP_021883506.1 hypothetical protein BCR41DRAFT_244276 [Lobosporangium transversale]
MTETERVKWVCVEHYRSTYGAEEQSVFENVMKMTGAKYDSQLGKVAIAFYSRKRAREFFGALTNAKHVYELDIKFHRVWSKADLEALVNVLRMSSVMILRLELGWAQGIVARKLRSTYEVYEILGHIIEIRKMKTIRIVLPPDLIKLSKLPNRKPPHLHELSFEMRPREIGNDDLRILFNSLKTNTTLTRLELVDKSIRNEEFLVLLEALKTNTTLTDLWLRWGSNSIGDERTLALSAALKSNTTLTHLELSLNAVGDEGALAFSVVLKSNTTLINLNLNCNSIGDKGALALSEALRVNTTLTALDLRSNSF